VLVFPRHEESGHTSYRVLSYFWLPEKAAREQRELVSWYNWQHGGHIQITPGDMTDFPLVKDFILSTAARFNVRQLLYDERFAQTLCQSLQDEHGIFVTPFTQTPRNFTGPMDHLVASVVSKRIRHNGNAV